MDSRPVITRIRRTPAWIVAAAGYTGLAIVLTWPLARHLTGVPHDVGDPILNEWILWWNSRAVPFTAAWWNAPAFWPVPGALAFSEHMAGVSVITTPLLWMGAHPQVAYNVALLATWPLSALAAHALCHRLTGRHDAAIVGALVFGFAPYRMGQTPHVQVLTSWWMALALLALHRAIDSESPRRAGPWIALFACAWLLQSLANGYYLFYFSVLVALWLLWFVPWRRAPMTGLALVAAWWGAVLLALPVLLEYRAVHARWGFERSFEEIAGFGADVTSFFMAPSLIAAWPFHPQSGAEREVYPGIVAVALVIAAVIACRRVTHPRPERRALCIARTVLLIGAATFTAVALATVAVGRWRLNLGLLSIRASTIHKPMTVAFLAFAAWTVTTTRFRAGMRRRSAFAFYATATVILALFAMGPIATAFGVRVLDKPPYWWLMTLPGMPSLRVPTRFAMVLALTLATAAAIAFDRLTATARPALRRGAGAIAILLLVVDSWTRPLPMHAPRDRFSLPASIPADAAVLELPLGRVTDYDVAAMYRGMFHRHNVVNGYSGYIPASHQILGTLLDEHDPGALDVLATYSPLCVVVDRRLDLDRGFRAFVEGHGLRHAGTDWEFEFYLMSRQPAQPFSGRVVPIVSIVANANQRDVVLMHDGDTGTSWDSGAFQRGDEQIVIALDELTSVRGVSLSSGPRIGNYSRALAIDASPDGTSWHEVFRGSTGAATLAGVLADPAGGSAVVQFAATNARMIRLRQLGKSTRVYWSVAEVAVLQ